ncbi:MAG TPA: type II toxin-antitoxin system prevent-host-death family antitoxin [Vicinamibacteria bacterium]|nr:type II toxin-antitoxin system prevent-host-death family antitoxin [Vicinamibacteria bacterium]
MKQVNIYEAKTRLSQLVEDAASGEDVVIARAGKPVARLTQLDKSEKRGRKRRLGLLDGRFTIPDDFNRPLPEEMIRAFTKR